MVRTICLGTYRSAMLLRTAEHGDVFGKSDAEKHGLRWAAPGEIPYGSSIWLEAVIGFGGVLVPPPKQNPDFEERTIGFANFHELGELAVGDDEELKELFDTYPFLVVNRWFQGVSHEK